MPRLELITSELPARSVPPPASTTLPGVGLDGAVPKAVSLWLASGMITSVLPLLTVVEPV